MKYFIILSMVILTAGCIDNILSMGQTSPVIYVDVTVKEMDLVKELGMDSSVVVRLNETNNNTAIVSKIEVYGGEMPKLSAPKESLADTFPAVYVAVVQGGRILNYQTGLDYRGPGMYNFTLGLEYNVNKSIPLNMLVRTINESGDDMHSANFKFNWSEQKQNKTFI